MEDKPLAAQASARHSSLLRRSLKRYARLLVKANDGTLDSNELDQVFRTAISIKQDAWELGLTNLQLELMLEQTIALGVGEKPVQSTS